MELNQVPSLKDYNLFDSDAVLKDAVTRHGADWHSLVLSRYGAQLGSGAVIHLGERANRYAPALKTHDLYGNRIDAVEFDAAWHALMQMLYAEGVHCLPWDTPRRGAHVARAAAFHLHGQIEAGTLCPTTMTFAAIPLLSRESALFAQLKDKLLSRAYDSRDVPLLQKHSLCIGMGMTEKQGGSDLRGNATEARATADGRVHTLTGHKWFFSAPTSDAHIVLANLNDAPSCFFVPRWRFDGTRNGVHLQRLKDKLGNRSNASAEVEFDDADGILLGERGRGIATIIEMAAQTRLDCVLGSAALMRQAFVQALHHARLRQAFGRPLVRQPLMRTVLVDLAIESEAATRLALRLAAARERMDDDPVERAFWRIVTPAAKFWVCKRAIAVTAECMEVLGGNGYVEDWPLTRLYREAPVNSIWEGSGNVVCLDMLRGLARDAVTTQALLDALNAETCKDAVLASAMHEFASGLYRPREAREAEARRMAQQLVRIVQALLLMQEAPARIAEQFIASRLQDGMAAAGATRLEISHADADAILERAWPAD